MVFIRCKNLIEKFLGFLVFPRGQLHIQIVLDSCCLCFSCRTVRLEGILDIFSILSRFLTVDILAVNGKVKFHIRGIFRLCGNPVKTVNCVSTILPCYIFCRTFKCINTMLGPDCLKQFDRGQPVVYPCIRLPVFIGHAVISLCRAHDDHAAVPVFAAARDGFCILHCL